MGGVEILSIAAEPSDRSAEQPLVRAKLKWFNAAKGFGFVIPEDNPVDAFLHITQLQRLGIHGLGEGATILCSVDHGQKGATVIHVEQIIDVGAIPADMLQYDPENDGVAATKGIVKWYKPDKGFGFITPDDGMKDIFVHKTCLDKAEIQELYAGQRVRITFKTAPKGREAVSISIESNP